MADIWTRLVDQIRSKFLGFASPDLVDLDGIFGLTEKGKKENRQQNMAEIADDRLREDNGQTHRRYRNQPKQCNYDLRLA